MTDTLVTTVEAIRTELDRVLHELRRRTRFESMSNTERVFAALAEAGEEPLTADEIAERTGMPHAGSARVVIYANQEKLERVESGPKLRWRLRAGVASP